MEMYEALATVKRREQVAEGYCLLVLECPQVAAEAQAGQFVHVRVRSGTDPLLRRRPFSIMLANPKAGELQLLVANVGRGSAILCRAQPGDVIDLLGPLGKPWPLPEVGEDTGDSGAARRTRPLLVAGGSGVASLIFLADTLQNLPGDCYVRGLFGARTEELLACWLEFSTRCEHFEIATDDGSAGYKGMVTDLLAAQVGQGDVDVVYACGPPAMLKTAAAICRQADLPCYVSLEERMGCGVGACMGCVVPTVNQGADRYKRVCTDGPAFEARQIDWEEFVE